MPFIPHTEEDIAAMLKTIGIARMEELFDEIPSALRQTALEGILPGLSEMALTRLAKERAHADDELLCFLGAGAYYHYIPAVVWDLATRGEFYTAYTPYQAEASQGSLQLIYEFQTMMASLMSMEVSNASLYEGGSAFAEAILMAVRLSRHHGNTHILVPQGLHPNYRKAAETIVKQQHISLIEIPYDPQTGRVDRAALNRLLTPKTVALAIPQPNFFGVLEEVDQLTDWAAEHHLFSIAIVNPLAMALLKPPGQWGEKGVDMACGEGQPLGIPMASGGPYYGFLCTRKSFVRQMPGRIVGKTVDQAGKPGYVLTLQAREQHIRRAKATSNICTNQGLMVTASTIYMALMGPDGLRRIALCCHENTRLLREALAAIPGIKFVFTAPFFHEIVIQVNQSAAKLIEKLGIERIQAGVLLSEYYPELKNCILICATELTTANDIKRLSERLEANMQATENAVNGRSHVCHPA